LFQKMRIAVDGLLSKVISIEIVSKFF